MYNNPPVISRLKDLKQLPQWVCYPHGSKVPLNPKTGKGADCNNPESWGTYEEARKAWSENKDWYAGLGFEFVKEQGITGVDLDKCVIDGELTPWAREVLTRLNSYAEYSPSGTGIHIWVRGNIPNNFLGTQQEEPRIEMYDHLKYFTVTGRHIPGTPETIEDRQEELTALYQEACERRAAQKSSKQKKTTAPDPSPRVDSPYGTPYGLSALQNELMDMAMAGNGHRNIQLNRSAYALGQLLAGGELNDKAYIERELFAVAQGTGLPEQEIDRTIRSGLEGGMLNPRSAPPSKAVTWEKYKPEQDKNAENGNGHQEHTGNTPKKEITAEELCDFTDDDAGNGDALYALYGQDFLYCSARGWFKYTGTHWELDTEGAEVKQYAVKTLRTRRHAAVELNREAIIKCTKADEKRVTGAVSRFKTLVSVSIDQFDKNPDLLNCKNGVVDLRTGEVTPHSREQRFTYCVSVAYKPSYSPELLDYLHSVVGGGQEVIDYLQMALGYSLTGHTREEILFYLFGPPRSGKGTLAEVFMRLLPDPISTMVDFNSFTAKREGDVSNFDLAPLKPSRMIFASESNRSQSLNPAKIKQLTGGDQVRACFKHKDFFSYRPQFKVWMMSNHPVNGDPEDDALWGRVRVIEFPNSFLGNEDKMKKERLKSQECLETILYWAVEGAMKWYSLGATGLTTPNAVAETTQKQREELDYIQQWLDEMCKDDKEYWTPNEEIVASYLEWCKSNNVQYPKGPKALSQSLKAKGYEVGVVRKFEGKTRRGIEGLRISID